jgi:predicted RNA-binding Zn ribbon-like protein
LTDEKLWISIRQCADVRGCGVLFLDRTRNRSRRWCSMKSCGNRAKAQRHYTPQHATLR